jgi:predicted enzyme related to lactoylglutathione lyase
VNNPVVYFEIPVNDIDCAVIFYQNVFGYQFERTSIDGNEMAIFPNDEDGFGISGALAKGDSYLPGKQGARVYFNANNIDEILSKAVAVGGKVAYPKTSIGELGWVAEFEDCEGNIIALHSK